MTRADRLALGLAWACALFGLGWVCRGAFDPARRGHEHTVAEMPVVSSAESLVIRYEFSGVDCTVRRR